MTAPQALEARLERVRTTLGLEQLQPPGTLHRALGDLLDGVRGSKVRGGAWLVLVALTGAMPDPAMTQRAAHAIDQLPTTDAVWWLLKRVTPFAVMHGNPLADVRVVTDRPLVDVDSALRAPEGSGLHLILRGLASRWAGDEAVELVVWSDRAGAYRRLHDDEAAYFRGERSRPPSSTSTPAEVCVPWNVPVVVLDVPTLTQNARLLALAEHTSSSLRLVGHDCAPVVSPGPVGSLRTEEYGAYLELVKNSARVASVSDTAFDELTGFADALGTQGLSGPELTRCPLPHTLELGGDAAVPPPAGTRPVVVCIGTPGHRTDAVAVLCAAELLWRDGVDFELRLLGPVVEDGSPASGIAARLRAEGAHLVLSPQGTSIEVRESLQSARAVLCADADEGWTPTPACALTLGVPVLGPDFGTVRELTQGSGGLLVDTEDPRAVAAGLRALLTDDALHAGLVAEAAGRAPRTTDDFADDLWGCLLG